MSTSALEIASPRSSTGSRNLSVDGRAREQIGAQSRSSNPASGDEGNGSITAEPPSRFGPRDLNEVDQGSTQAKSAVNSPAQSRAPLPNNEGATITRRNEGPDTSTSERPSSRPIIGRMRTFMSPDSNNVPRLQAVFDWSEVTDDEDLGDVPEFPVLGPSHVPSEWKIEHNETCPEKDEGADQPKKNSLIGHLRDWTEFDEEMAEFNKPGPNESDESLRKLWDDENRGGSIRVQNFALKGFRKAAREQFTEKCEEVENLQERVRELELMVIEAQTREEMAQKLMKDAYQIPKPVSPYPTEGTKAQVDGSKETTGENSEQKTATKVDDDPPYTTEIPLVNPSRSSLPAEKVDPPSIIESPEYRPDKNNTRFWKASSLLPGKSSVKRAIVGGGPSEPDSSESDSEDEHSSTESSGEETRRTKKTKARMKVPTNNKHSRPEKDESKASRLPDGDSSDDPCADLLAMEPESDHSSDSSGTKKIKQIARRKHRARLNLLKYQQGFLKHEPLFTYNGEANSSTFKKWVREVGQWHDRAKLSTKQTISMIGKYLGGNAYRFYERDVLDLKKKYSLTEFFEQLFDYTFPSDFRMLQRQRFLECRQEGKQGVQDYIRRLRNIADTTGDVDE